MGNVGSCGAYLSPSRASRFSFRLHGIRPILFLFPYTALSHQPGPHLARPLLLASALPCFFINSPAFFYDEPDLLLQLFFNFEYLSNRLEHYLKLTIVFLFEHYAMSKLQEIAAKGKVLSIYTHTPSQCQKRRARVGPPCVAYSSCFRQSGSPGREAASQKDSRYSRRHRRAVLHWPGLVRP